MNIIGITGTYGAGKGETVDYLKTKGFAHLSARAFIIEEVKRRGLPVNRDTNIAVGNELRKEHSPSYIIECLYREALKSGRNCVIESIRAVGEIDFLRHDGPFWLIAVNAPQKMRYERIVKRNTALDHMTFVEFEEKEKQEMTSTDPNKQNLSTCIRQADFTIENDGTIAELRRKIDGVLAQMPT